MATDIAVTALTGNASAGQIAWIATAPPPAGFADLSYMRAAKIEVWTSATNNRANATKLGESDIGLVIQAGLAANTTRYAWARAVDEAGNVSDWFPASANGGRTATTLSTAPGPDSVGPDELQDDAVDTEHIRNLAVTNAKIVSLSASKIISGTITATISIDGPTITGGTIRTGTGATRVEMSGANNSFAVYKSGTTVVSISSAAIVPSIVVRGHSAQGMEVTGGSSTNTGHAIRGYGYNGGRGLMGVASGGGAYAFYTEIGGYGSFTGVHDAFLRKAAPYAIGDIAVIKRVVGKGPLGSIDDAVPEIEISSAARQKTAYGVISRVAEFDAMDVLSGLPFSDYADSTALRRLMAQNYLRAAVNAIGEGLMNVCGRGGNIEVGDYICTSTMPGKGMRQTSSLTLVGATIISTPDDVLRNYTVAKAMEAVTFASPDEVRLVACTYHCG